MEHNKKINELQWTKNLAYSPTTEQFSTSERSIPESVHLFLTELLKSEKHNVSRC